MATSIIPAPATRDYAISGTSAEPVTLDIYLENSTRHLILVQRLTNEYALYGVVVQANGTVNLAPLVPPANTTYFTVSSGTRTFSVTALSSGVSIVVYG